jgi:hypothetical protein
MIRGGRKKKHDNYADIENQTKLLCASVLGEEKGQYPSKVPINITYWRQPSSSAFSQNWLLHKLKPVVDLWLRLKTSTITLD